VLAKPTMKTRAITLVRCPCGHGGSTIERVDDEAVPDSWHFNRLRFVFENAEAGGPTRLRFAGDRKTPSRMQWNV
jgi:hypothetical protein